MVCSNRLLDPTPRVSDPVDLFRDQRTRLARRLPDAADFPELHFEELPL